MGIAKIGADGERRTSAAQPRRAAKAAPDTAALNLALAGAIVLLLGLQLSLAVAMTVNWDEFHFLSQVHEYDRGELSLAVNSFHVHFFQWLLLIPGGEINQIVSARLVMLALEAGTVLAIVGSARAFVPLWAALGSAIVYLSFGNVFVHGPSFRTDPISTFLLMSALWLIVRSALRPFHAVVIGVLVALAALVTIKSAIYLPTFALCAFWRWRTAPDRTETLRTLALAAAAGAVALASLFWLHSSSLAVSAASSADTASSAYRKTLQTGRLFPEGRELARTVLVNPIHWFVLLLGLSSTATNAIRARGARWAWIVLGAFALPLATLAFYRNAFPYYYGFMLAPVCVVASLALSRLFERRIIGLIVVAILLASAGLHYAVYIRRDQQPQRAVVAAVHAMFPQSVPYVERAGMIGAFPDAGLFMTTWGVDRYRDVGEPLFGDAGQGRRPVFVISGHPGLETALTGVAGPADDTFLPEDAGFLRRNFVHHWGPIWVAGQKVALHGGARRIKIEVPGPYTLESRQTVVIDGAATRPGQSVNLAVGAHEVAGPAADVVLRWGRALYRPDKPLPAGRLYWGF